MTWSEFEETEFHRMESEEESGWATWKVALFVVAAVLGPTALMDGPRLVSGLANGTFKFWP